MRNSLSTIEIWTPPVLPEDIPKGDTPGDKVKISGPHIKMANAIFPLLLKEIKTLSDKGQDKIVVAVCGCSGSGKSGTSAILSYYLNETGIGTYNLSGDNYPRRIPEKNDAERIRIYEEGGATALDAYLGSEAEIDFAEVTEIIRKFKSGEAKIALKRMGRTEEEIWYEEVDFSAIHVIVIDWTHANSDNYSGVDIPVFLYNTPQETLKYRILRNRDTAIDSPFVSLVLELEQKKIEAMAHKAKIILSQDFEVISYEECKNRIEKSNG